MRSNRTNRAERLLHDAGVGSRVAGMSESKQKLHRNVSKESDEHDQDEGGDYAEDLKSEGNRHDSSTNYTGRDVEHGTGDRRSPRARLRGRQ